MNEEQKLIKSLLEGLSYQKREEVMSFFRKESVDDDWNLAEQESDMYQFKNHDVKKCRDKIIKDLLSHKKEHNSITYTTINRAIIVVNKRFGDL